MKEEVIEFNPLYESMYRCKKGVLWKSSTASFCLNGLENILKLERELKDGTYTPRIPYCFTITSPKKRSIMSICFRDRVYQRSLNDIAVYPQMVKSFIYDNFACQKGKGTDKAREKLKVFLRRMYLKHETNFFVLQCDIHGYYPNMSHAVAKEKFKKGLDQWSYEQSAKIFDGQYEGDIGFNPGSQMVQIAGISVLDGLDHFIKERLHIKCYLRYMDDFILLSDDKEYLKFCKKSIAQRLDYLGLELNEKKTDIYGIDRGIMFLGFRFKVTHTGKVILLIDPESIKRERKKLSKLVNLYKNRKINKQKIYECYLSWKNHALKGNSFNIIVRMDKYLKSLFAEVQNGNH